MRRIIYVDDMQSNLELFKDKLSSNFELVTILGSVGAEEKILNMKDDCDAVILDVVMPVVSGLDLYRNLSYKIENPIIFKSMGPSETTYVEALKVGKGELLTADMSFEQIKVRIENIASSFCIHINENCRYYPKKRQIKNYQSEILLTEIEAKIFETLYNAEFKRVDIDKLIQKVWGHNTLVDRNTSSTHLSNLRKKIKTVGLKLTKGKTNDYFILNI